MSDGFVALDTFRNNIANYTNTTNSYPTLSIAFGTTAVPEPGATASLLAGAPAPERRFQPAIFLGQARHRMMAAFDFMKPAIFLHHRIVDLMEARQLDGVFC